MNLTKHCFLLCCICWDCSFSIAELSISQNCLCLHLFTVFKYDNYLHNGPMVHSNNLGNIKEKLHLQIENPPYEISDRRNCPIFYYSFFLFTLMIITIFNVSLV